MASKRVVLFFCFLSLLVITMAARELAETAKEETKETAVVKPDGYDTQYYGDRGAARVGGYGRRGYCGGVCHYGGFGGCYRCCHYSGCRCCAPAEEAARVNALGKPQN